MCSQLRQIYDKKSPIFLTEVGILIATALVLQYPQSCHEHLHAFYLAAMAVSAAEVLLKSVGLVIVHALNKELANTLQTLLVGLFIVLHVALWVYSIVLLKNGQFVEMCSREEPHYFYVKMYVFVYGIIVVGSIGLLVVLLIPVAALTIFSFKKKDDPQDI